MNRHRQGAIACGRIVISCLSVLTALAGCGGNSDSNTSTALSCGGANGTGASVTISGKLRYEDKEFNQNGFTGAVVLKPIRFAAVEAVRNCDSAVLDSTSSNANGDYTVTFSNTGSAGVYMRAKAVASLSAGEISVESPQNAVYSVISAVIDDTAATVFTQDLQATTAAGGGVFNLLDVATSGAEFVNAAAGAALPPLTIVWSDGSCDGTYFSPGDNSIHVLGGGDINTCPDVLGDTDEYDDAVVMHEFGHFTGAAFSRDDSPGGIHFLYDNTQDIRLSWSEGWGNFFASAARNDPLYLDTIDSDANISFSLEDLSTVMGFDLAADVVYTTNEISVAAVLWDIFDATPSENLADVGGTDAVSAGMTPIWDVIANYFTCVGCGITHVSFENFWDGWFDCSVCATANHGLSVEMAALAADRMMALAADAFESDGTAGTAPAVIVGGAAQPHTLFPAGDMDYVSFAGTAGTQYTLRTSGLTNGADTVLELFDTDGTTSITSNDDAAPVTKNSNCGVNLVTQMPNCPPNDDTLASTIVFTPSVSGTYFVRVMRAPSAPPSAGVYGAYNLRVTSP